MPKKKINKKHPIQFEYCECGCKCYSAYSKGIGYSIFWDLEKKENAFYVDRGHGILGTRIGVANSYEEAVKIAQDDYDKIP